MGIMTKACFRWADILGPNCHISLMVYYQNRRYSFKDSSPAMYSTEMALSQSTSFLTFHKHQFVETSQNLRKLISPTTEIPRYPLISSFDTGRSKPWSPLRPISCVSGAVSDDGTREEPSPISSIFVKGLPDSVSEGRLKKVFSEFGQVSNVKIIINVRTLQSLGYGYVWFNSKEDAQLAVEAMNGKVHSS